MEQVAAGSKGTRRSGRTKQERRAIVEESMKPGATVTEVARAHGIRPSQVFDWRRLYQQGRLNEEGTSTALVPVRITGVGKARTSAGAVTPAREPFRATASGVIQVELDRARVTISGAADPVALQAVLEYLLG